VKSLTKKQNPGYVTTTFCDERTHRVEEKIDSTKTEILNAINGKIHPPMPWSAKATIIAAFIASVSATIVAYIH